MPAGRPTKYNDAIIEKAREYLNNLPEDEVIHSIEGLADYLSISRETVYDWCRDENKTIFSDIVKSVLIRQGKSLLNNGLNGKFAQSIAKVILTKHGYREGIETTGKDGGAIAIDVNDKTAIDNAIKRAILPDDQGNNP